MAAPLVLGIETSCDETGIGLVRGRELLADSVASSVGEHARFGGVVPEVASRAHLEAMIPTFDRALATAGVDAGEIDAVAVTAGPGLAGALLVGVAAAKAYAFALGKPLYGVNHLAAHIAVDQLEHGPLPSPAVALLVSGGHSSLLLVPDVTQQVVPLGATIDDAAGEAYDKVARVLGMPFPGGPPIDKAAREGDAGAISFPRGKYHDGTFDFSFAGLKTAVARWVEARRAAGEPVPTADVAASFQEAVADVLTRKAVQACLRNDVTDLIIGGGVAANSRLRSLAAERCQAAGLRLRVPRPGLCTDNGAMVAALGAEIVSRGVSPSPLDLPADSSLPVTEVVVRLPAAEVDHVLGRAAACLEVVRRRLGVVADLVRVARYPFWSRSPRRRNRRPSSVTATTASTMGTTRLRIAGPTRLTRLRESSPCTGWVCTGWPCTGWPCTGWLCTGWLWAGRLCAGAAVEVLAAGWAVAGAAAPDPASATALRRLAPASWTPLSGAAPPASVLALASLPPEISWPRFSANLSTSLPPTSTMTPRPNWAGRPVTFIVVCMMTLVASPDGSGSRDARTVAEAVPAPRVSLPEASTTTNLASGSRSVNFAVPR